MNKFSKMDDDNTIYLTMADADQIYFFQKWFTLWSLNSYITDMVELISCFTEKYCTTYIFQQIMLENISKKQSQGSGYASQAIFIEYSEASTNKVLLKYHPSAKLKSIE